MSTTYQKFSDGSIPEAPDPFESVSTSLEEIERLIKWLGYVAENEFTKAESVLITSRAKAFAAVLQPVASKYLD